MKTNIGLESGVPSTLSKIKVNIDYSRLRISNQYYRTRERYFKRKWS